MGTEKITFFLFLVESTEIVKILHHLDDRNTFTYYINEQGMLSEIFTFLKKQKVILYFPGKRRLSGIRISSETSGPDAISFQKAKFSFIGDEENNLQIGYERINLNNSSLFAFTNLTEELSSISVELVHPNGFYVTSKSTAFSDMLAINRLRCRVN